MILEFLKGMDMPYWFTLVLLFFYYLVIKLNWIAFIKALFDKRERKVKKLLKYKKDDLHPAYVELIEEEINNYIFYRCTGISTHRELREQILLLSKQHHIPMFYFKRAIQYIKMENKNIKIIITKLDTVGKWVNIIFGVILLVTSIAIFLILAMTLTPEAKNNPYDLIYLSFLTLFFSLAGIFILTQNEKLSAAKYIKNKIETINE